MNHILLTHRRSCQESFTSQSRCNNVEDKANKLKVKSEFMVQLFLKLLSEKFDNYTWVNCKADGKKYICSETNPLKEKFFLIFFIFAH